MKGTLLRSDFDRGRGRVPKHRGRVKVGSETGPPPVRKGQAPGWRCFRSEQFFSLLNLGSFPRGPRITLHIETQRPQEAAALPMGDGIAPGM